MDPRVRQRADELHANGMPYQMAMAVAHGKLELNEALERLERKEQVNKLMRKHDLSRALATQVAIGHADLDQVLARRRREAHRGENRDRTCLVASEVPITLGLMGKRVVTGVITQAEAYTFRFRERGAEEDADIHKLKVKYAYAPGDWKKAKKAIRMDKRIASLGEEPALRPQDRYSCSDKRLFAYMDANTEVGATLMEGEQVRGVVRWFGRYEFGLEVRGGVELTIFRHALRDLTS